MKSEDQKKFEETVTIRNCIRDIFAVDMELICSSKTDDCFLEVNRGYKCKKHRTWEKK